MRVLVTAASKHGSTAEIAQTIVDVLVDRGQEAMLVDVDSPESIEDADAVIVGSAVYAGMWLAPARQFVERNADALRRRPVWLFSSGPIGDPPRPHGEEINAAPLVRVCCARGHRVFAGRLEKVGLGFAERALVLALRAPFGDYRDWTAIRGWAADIADSLAAADRTHAPGRRG